MPTRNIVLTEEQSRLVERLVGSGRYQNASEVLREGLRLIETREREAATRLEALGRAAQAGIADIKAGRYSQFDSVEALDDHLRVLTEEALKKDDT